MALTMTMDEIVNIAEKYNLIIIEDACQSLGAEFNNVKVGRFGVGCFSFYPTKNLSCPGDGGGISIFDRNDDLVEKVRMISEYGWNNERKVIEEGLNSRLDELHAKFLLTSLENFNQELSDKQNLLKDIEVREHLTKKLSHASVSRIDIERTADNARVLIHTARPGIVIGKKGEDIDKMREDITTRMGIPVTLSIQEIRKPDLDAKLLAESVAQQLERRVMFRSCLLYTSPSPRD